MTRLWRRVGTALYWLAWPALLVYLRLGARTRVLVLADNQVLLVQGWLSDARWGLPGGGLHHGEPPAAGAVRETAEETGLHLDAAQLRPLGSEWCRDQGRAFYCHFFVAELAAHPPAVRRQRGEITAVQWSDRGAVVALPVKADVRRALELLG